MHVESHDAVKRLFGKHLVQENSIENEYAIILREEQDDRLLADYDVTYLPDEEQLEERILDAKKFLNRILEYIQTSIEIDETEIDMDNV